MTEYWVSFYSHYDALTFHTECRSRGIKCSLSSVPRSLSSSCGTAAMVISDESPLFFDKAEAVYVKSDGRFEKLEVK